MAPNMIANHFHNTLSMENMLHRTTNLTCTDDENDIPLNPDGTVPTPAEKALDILTNTTTKAVINQELHTWELLTTRHAPFGMPLSEQDGENWWMAADSSAQEEQQLREEENAAQAAAIESTRQAIERNRQAVERIVAILVEESRAELDVRMESLRQIVAMEIQVLELTGDQPAHRRRTRRRRRQERDSGVDCEF
jgi:hypothetical protein